ncbi:MAG TPA: hypothetical protein VIM10_02380 [Actinopolymorphaceae bacterium]
MCGRVLAAEVVALTDLPAADTSAMDGLPVELSVQNVPGVRPAGPSGRLPRDHVRRTGEEARRGDVG